MSGAEEVEEAWRIHVVVDEERIQAVSHVINANTCCPTIAAIDKLALDGWIESEEVGQPERAGAGKDRAELVDQNKRIARVPDHGPGKVEFLQLPEQRI